MYQGQTRNFYALIANSVTNLKLVLAQQLCIDNEKSYFFIFFIETLYFFHSIAHWLLQISLGYAVLSANKGLKSPCKGIFFYKITFEPPSVCG